MYITPSLTYVYNRKLFMCTNLVNKNIDECMNLFSDDTIYIPYVYANELVETFSVNMHSHINVTCIQEWKYVQNKKKKPRRKMVKKQEKYIHYIFPHTPR